MSYIDINSEEYGFLYGKNNTMKRSNTPIYDGSPLPKQDTFVKPLSSKEQSNYFVQGAEESGDENDIDPLDSGYLLEIDNFIFNAPGTFVDAVLFSPRTLPLDAIQPAGIVVQVNGAAFAPPENVPPYVPPPVPPNLQVRRNYIRKEQLAQPLIFEGLKIIAQNFFDATLPIRLLNRQVNGKVIQYSFQPAQYTSPSNFSSNIIDIPDFSLVLDSNTTMVVGKERLVGPLGPPGQQFSQKLLQFTTVRSSELTNNFFSRSVVRSLKAKRPLGIPMYDENRNKTYHVIKNNPFEDKKNEI